MLWSAWLSNVLQLRSAFSRQRTFFWFIIVLIGFTIRDDNFGVTSFVRATYVDPTYYCNLCHLFVSKAINLDSLTVSWTSLCLKIFHKFLFIVNDRIILLVDGIKIGKEGKKMPGVKSLHQDSQSNSKKEYIMGHSFQVISLLVNVSKHFFAVPLVGRIHEGYVLNNRWKKTLYDKLIDMFTQLQIHKEIYMVADAYYACGKVIKGLLASNRSYLITRIRNTSVAYFIAAISDVKGRGRPKKYGEKIALKKIFSMIDDFVTIPSPVYGEENIEIKYFSLNLLWKPVIRLVQFVWVVHPTRGKLILLSSDLSLAPEEIIRLYGLRFKIEVSFKEALRRLGSYCYHFWMKDMKKNKIGNGDQYLHKETYEYRIKFLEKIKSYNLYVQFGLIAQGLLQYLSMAHTKLVWRSFGSWIRTIRPNVLPSESVTALSMSNSYLNFLTDGPHDLSFRKFLRDRVTFRKKRIKVPA